MKLSDITIYMWVKEEQQFVKADYAIKKTDSGFKSAYAYEYEDGWEDIFINNFNTEKEAVHYQSIKIKNDAEYFNNKVVIL